jgi:hypothetical protein
MAPVLEEWIALNNPQLQMGISPISSLLEINIISLSIVNLELSIFLIEKFVKK